MNGEFDTVIIGPPGSKLPAGADLSVSGGKAGIDMLEQEDATETDRTPMYFVIACAFLVLAAALATSAVFILFGLGWSLMVGAAACAGAGVIMMRGLVNA